MICKDNKKYADRSRYGVRKTDVGSSCVFFCFFQDFLFLLWKSRLIFPHNQWLSLLGRHLPQRQSWHIVFGLLMLACNSGPAGCHMQARGLPFAIPRGAKWGPRLETVSRPEQRLYHRSDSFHQEVEHFMTDELLRHHHYDFPSWFWYGERSHQASLFFP